MLLDSELFKISAAHYNNANSFYYDAVGFMQTNRFKRFVDFIETKATEMFRNMNIFKDKNPKIEDFVYDAIIKFLFNDDDDETDIPKRSFSTYDMVKCSTCGFSPVWEYAKLQKCSDEFAVREIVSVMDLPIFSHLAKNALHRACYDFIHIQTISQDLSDENWLVGVKAEFSYDWMFYILSRVFEYTLCNVENFASYSLWVSPEKGATGIPEMLDDERDKQIQQQSAEVNKLKTELDSLNSQLAAEKSVSQSLSKEVSSLKQSLEAREDYRDENRQLHKELKNERAEYQKLSEKFQSLQEYAEKLAEEPDEAPEEENEALSPEIQNMRIVFVRDKENEGYVMMKKLAEMFPNAKFTNGIASDINPKTTDMVVALISYTCHGTYWGASGIAKKNGIPFLAIKNKNVSVIAAGIQSILKG